MNPKSYKHKTIYLKNEMRSWSRNKMEDRKLLLQNSMVDKHMAMTRKSHMFEKEALSKDFEKKMSKTTPTTDEYLDRSYHRYTAWREREKERLDRRYRGLYKSYLKEYSELSLQGYAALQTPRTPRPPKHTHSLPEIAHDDAPMTPLYGADSMAKSEENYQDADKGADNPGEVVTVEKLSIGSGAETKSNVDSPNKTIRRRASTGSIDIPEYLNLKKLSLLPQLSENAHNAFENVDGTPTDATSNESEGKSEAGQRETTPSDIKELQTPAEARRRRRSSISALADDPIHIPLGTRLDRRPTMPNIAIPVNFAN